MQLTFISPMGALVSGLILTLLVCIYFWKVRPYLETRAEFHDFYDLADSFWSRVWEWLKIRWGLVWGAIVAAAPMVWNGGLDALVAINLAVSNGGLDLSWLVIPPWLKSIIQLGSVLLPIIQAFRVKKDA